MIDHAADHALSWKLWLFEPAVDKPDASTDVGLFIRSQTSVRGLLHDKSADDKRQGRFGRRALATGGIIDGPIFGILPHKGMMIEFTRADGTVGHGELFIGGGV